jgi:hypothetical protein
MKKRFVRAGGEHVPHEVALHRLARTFKANMHAIALKNEVKKTLDGKNSR